MAPFTFHVQPSIPRNILNPKSGRNSIRNGRRSVPPVDVEGGVQIA